MPSIEEQRTHVTRTRPAPGEMISAQPWSFLALALTVGVAAGLLLRFKGVRKALRIYLLVRRFV